MYNIAICIPTYKRPVGLKKLIKSITECDIDKTLIKDLNIIVVDNDIDRSAELVITELKDKFFTKYKINYFNYPIKGLSNVRNELINKALLKNPDFIIFIDDDEYASSNWLNELVNTIIMNKGDLAMGPVNPIMETNTSKYLLNWYERPIHLNNTKLDYIRTGNLIINVKSLLESNVRFDPKFNSIGSEDSYFGIQMMKKGASIYWAANAIVYELIPEKRATLKWLIKRSYNGANTFVYILRLENNKIGLIKKFFISSVYLFCGSIALVILPFPIRKKYWGILKIVGCIGGFTGLIGIQFHEYSKDR